MYESESVGEGDLTKGEMDEGLCQSCLSSPFMSLLSQPLQETVFPKSFSQTQESAAVCRLCALVFESLKCMVSGSVEEQYDGILLCVPPLDDAKEPASQPPNVVVVSGSEIGFISILPPTGGQAHFPLLNSRLKTCDESHEHPKSFSAELPARVIQVGEASDLSLIYLHSSTPSERGTYIALSHCWGHSRAFTTTKETLDARTSSINFNELPRTFQEVITVTRQLGVQYLWIDSLCIVQDDPDDWKRESAHMETVFISAYRLSPAGSSFPHRDPTPSKSQVHRFHDRCGYRRLPRSPGPSTHKPRSAVFHCVRSPGGAERSRKCVPTSSPCVSGLVHMSPFIIVDYSVAVIFTYQDGLGN